MTKCTTKEIQVALKVSQKKIESLDFSHRLGFDNYYKEQIGLLRRQCKNIISLVTATERGYMQPWLG